MVDRLSKVAHFIPLGHPYMATMVAQAFFNTVVWLHRILSSVVNDQDPILMSNLWKELFTLADVKLCLSSAFHPPPPQSDSQSEVINKTIIMYL
jgi:hypothetical protein